jgi:hypothetical protein
MKKLTLLLLTGILALNVNLAFAEGETLCDDDRDGTAKLTTVTIDSVSGDSEVLSTSSEDDTTDSDD